MTWVTATRATDGGAEAVNLKSVDRMWTHENEGKVYTVLSYRTGQKVSYQEPMSYFIDATARQLSPVEVSWPDEA